VLRENGVTRALVEAGGDIAVSGAPPGERGWQVDVAAAGTPGRLTLVHAAVSSSGDTEQFVEIGGRRYSHIVDPRTGLGLTDRVAVTVVAPRGITSDSLATPSASSGVSPGCVWRRHSLASRPLSARPHRPPPPHSPHGSHLRNLLVSGRLCSRGVLSPSGRTRYPFPVSFVRMPRNGDIDLAVPLLSLSRPIPAKGDAAAMPTPHAADTKTRYQAALDCLVSKLQQDRYVLAAILCGSLSHDEVWEKSDIDLLLVGRDERKPVREYCLVEDDINIHALMFSRGEFRRRLEGALQSSFFHSYFSKSTLLFTHDETLREYYEDARRVGGRDRDLQLMQAGGIAFAVLAKAEKWYHVKHDLPYSFLYLCRVVMELATIETLLHDEVPGREVIQQALRHNPDFFRAVYTEFVDVPKTEETVGRGAPRGQRLPRRAHDGAVQADPGVPGAGRRRPHHHRDRRLFPEAGAGRQSPAGL
jgi:predicted nucleotidyltransferase